LQSGELVFSNFRDLHPVGNVIADPASIGVTAGAGVLTFTPSAPFVVTFPLVEGVDFKYDVQALPGWTITGATVGLGAERHGNTPVSSTLDSFNPSVHIAAFPLHDGFGTYSTSAAITPSTNFTVEAEFTAEAARLVGGSTLFFATNGFDVQAVPEPGCLTLTGFAALAIVGFRCLRHNFGV
jgi:hypothetical protein